MQLHRSAAAGDVQAVATYLTQGADVDTPDDPEPYSMDRGFTALMYAARSPHAGLDMLELLLSAFHCRGGL